MSTDRSTAPLWRQRLLVPVAAFVLGAISLHAGESHPTVTAEEALALAKADTTILLLDVRTKGEYESQTGHLKGALLIPVQELETRIGELEQFKGRKIIAYCRTGNRSSHATDYLNRQGFTVVNLSGGITEWNRKGYPVVREGER